MLRLILILLLVFGIALISLLVIYGLFSLISICAINEMNLLSIPLEINSTLINAFFKEAALPGIMFGSVITALFSIILYRALQKKQRIQVEHFLTIFRSYLLFTFFMALAYHLVILMIIYSKSGVFLSLPFIDLLGYFFDYTLPFIWLILAYYWVKKYEDKFLNDDEDDLLLK
jgi:hypothetical protein